MIHTGVFNSQHDAEEAVRLLSALGHDVDEIGIGPIDGTLGGFIVAVGSRDDTGRARTETGELEHIPPRRVVR